MDFLLFTTKPGQKLPHFEFPASEQDFEGNIEMADPIQFDRKPYTISWKDEKGEMRKIRRVPPPKLHEALPEDLVEIKRARSDDFKAGDDVTVKYINPRHPNTIQVTNKEGQTTFLNYLDMELKEKRAIRPGENPMELPERNKYLRWP